MKLCRKCGLTKPLSEFHRDSKKKDGTQSHCKVCSNKRAAEWNRNNPDRIAYFRSHETKDRRTLQRYNLTPDELAKLREAAGGKCAICGGATTRLVVDHDHETGAVRGLLCRHCNLGIGHLRDDPILIEAALRYLMAN